MTKKTREKNTHKKTKQKTRYQRAVRTNKLTNNIYSNEITPCEHCQILKKEGDRREKIRLKKKKHERMK